MYAFSENILFCSKLSEAEYCIIVDIVGGFFGDGPTADMLKLNMLKKCTR